MIRLSEYKKYLILTAIVGLTFSCSSCIFVCGPFLETYMEIEKVDETYEFKFSKQKLKSRIIDYTSVHSNINLTTDLSKSLGDTTDVELSKGYRSTAFRIIITENEKTSQIRVIKLNDKRKRDYPRSEDFYKRKFLRRIENKFIDKLD